MSKLEKDIQRLKLKPKDFTYNEMKKILNKFGFIEDNKGRTSGSRVVFKSIDLNKKIELHKPHPSNVLKMYQIKQIMEYLEEWRIL